MVLAGFAVVPGLLGMGLAFFLVVRESPLYEYFTYLIIGIFAISAAVTYFVFLRKPKTIADKQLEARLQALMEQEVALASRHPCR